MLNSLRRRPGGGDPHEMYALEEEFREHVCDNGIHGGGAGSVGPQGLQGEDGLSAYEVAVADGFQGDEAAWLASLVGPQGQTGPQGVPGGDGTPGTQGATGATGDPGADGLSAFELALLDGFVGSEQQWLDSLVGPEGPQGAAGTTDWNGLTNKPATFTPSAHTHGLADLSAFTVVRQSGDVTVATTALTNCPGMVFSFAAGGVYAVDLWLLATAAATTTGFGFALDTSVAVTTVALTFVHVLANTGTVTSGQSRADATATGLSSGVDSANVVVPVMGSGILVAGANAGSAQLQFRPEVAASATSKANSVMRVMRVA